MGAPMASPASMRMRERLRVPARATRRSAAAMPGAANASLSELPFCSSAMKREWNLHAACPAPALTTRYEVEWHRSRPRIAGSGAHECSAE